MKLLISELRLELEKEENSVSYLSINDFNELKFIETFKIITCNTEYFQNEELIHDLVFCFLILVNHDENNNFEYFKQNSILEILFFLLKNSPDNIKRTVNS